nr:DUF6311 domain-containing protein [Ectothiorhodospira variabilis]
MNYPEGINAAFADVIPLVAVPTKMFADLLPPDFHYFGYWLAFSYVLQGVAAAWLLHLMGVRDRVMLPLAVVLFLLSPAMLFRVHAHAALTFHAAILIALALYFLMTRPGAISNRSLMLSLAMLACVALLVHPYLLAMVVPIFMVGLVDRARLCDHGMSAQAVVLLGALAPVIFIMWAGGYLTHGVGQLSGGGGFGFNSMNLVAPLIGGHFLDMPSLQDQSGLYGTWPVPYDATGGQFEGYNHLGLGVIVGLLIVVMTQWRRLPSLVRRHAGLFLLMVGFTLYAISNKAFAAGIGLWEISLPQWMMPLAEQFRASGRFFWPVGYLLVLCMVLGLSALRGPSLGRVLLAGLVVVQVADTAPLRGMTREAAALEAPMQMNDSWWQHQAERAERIYLFPAFGCGAHAFEDIVPLQRLAAFSATPFNTGLIARGVGNCVDKESVLAEGLMDGSLYVFLDDYIDETELVSRFGTQVEQRCTPFSGGHVCTP